MKSFASRLIDWQRQYGRHHLPWQNTGNPYCIWLSEIMLQQTQVSTVLPYYTRFLERFPDVQTLAAASQDEVLGYWSGLGYYSRARNLHKAAQRVVAEYGGRFPDTVEQLADLPGIGRSTAAAIAAFGYGVRAAILDGNVKRLLARHAAVDGYPGEARVQALLWQEAESRLPEIDIGPYTQGLMDLGNMVCQRKPLCLACPLADDCQARLQGLEYTLPRPRPKKILPERACRLLILLDGRRVLMQTRTGPGVWQGLASLPDGAVEHDAQELASAHGFATTRVAELDSFVHVFSHYRLTIHASVLHVDKALAVHDAEHLHWLDLDNLQCAPLPAPVRRLLESVTAMGLAPP